MKIISKHRDYYDGVQGLGVDESLVYKRERCEIFSDLCSQILERFISEHKGIWRDYKVTAVYAPVAPGSLSRAENHGLFLHVIGFCGKLYPFLYYKRYGYPMRYPLHNEYLHPCDFQRMESTLQEHDPIFYESAFIERKVGFKTSKRERQINSLLQSVSDLAAVEWLDPFVGLKVPAFVIDLSAPKRDDKDRPPRVILNPCLKDYNFQRVKDAFTAYQEISMFLGGVIPRQAPETVEISDIDRLVGHGFDKRASFRNVK